MRVQRGFGAIAAIVILVMLASLAAAIVSVGTSQHLTSAQDVMSAKAWQASRAGNEWGLYKALKGETWGAGTCDTASRTAQMDLRADSGFNVSVYCDSWQYNEGEDPGPVNKQVRIYRIRSVACPAASCPASDASVAGVGYIERTRVVVAAN